MGFFGNQICVGLKILWLLKVTYICGLPFFRFSYTVIIYSCMQTPRPFYIAGSASLCNGYNPVVQLHVAAPAGNMLTCVTTRFVLHKKYTCLIFTKEKLLVNY